MLKILRPRGIRSLKFVPSSGPGAFFPGVFLTGALPPGRYEGHWSPDRVRGVLVPGKLWGIRSLSGWRGICSQSTCGGIRIRPFFRRIHSPQKLGAFTFYSCMILFSGYQGFYSFMMLFFWLPSLLLILVWCYFSGLVWKRQGILQSIQNIQHFFQVHSILSQDGDWGGICSQSTCGGICSRLKFRGIYSPKRPLFGGLCSPS